MMDTRTIETRVAQAIEELGSDATTANVARVAGVDPTTIPRAAGRLGYSKRGDRGGIWIDASKEDKASPELIDALNRIADAVSEKHASSGTINITLLAGVTRDHAAEAQSGALTADATYEDKFRAVQLVASYLLADK